MSADVGHGGRGGQSSPFVAEVDRTSAPFGWVCPRTVLCGLAIGLGGLTFTARAMATPAASPWSLLPQPIEVRPAPSGVVKIADGSRVGVRGADVQQLQAIADHFIELVAKTR